MRTNSAGPVDFTETRRVLVRPRNAQVALGLLFLLIAGHFPAAAQTVRIGVFGLFKPRQLTVTAMEGSVLVTKTGRDCPLVLDPSAGAAAASISASGSRIVLRSPEGTVYTTSLRTTARDGGAADFTLAVPGKIRRRYSGVLEVTASHGVLTAVVAMDMELAVASVVAAESPPGAPLEALKAQAVAARSYFFAGSGGHKGFEFCDTTHCQFLRKPPPSSAPSSIATHATRGLVLAYSGRPFPALYSASCGGRTHALAEVGIRPRDYPYYAVPCQYCRTHPDRWTVRLTPQQAADISRKTESERLDLVRRLGWSSVRSNEYLISAHDDHATVTGLGNGHGIGLCQRGAAALAQGGASFSAILAYYYPNTSLVTMQAVSPHMPR